MTPQRLHFRDLSRLALAAEKLSGGVRLEQLPRFLELLDSPLDNTAVMLLYQIQLSQTVDNRLQIAGSIEVQPELQLICQRCLKPMSLALYNGIKLTVVRTEEEQEQLDSSLEPLLLTEEGINLYDLLEDEIILCMPLSICHTLSACSAMTRGEKKSRNDGQSIQADRHLPFAVLPKLMNKKLS